VYASFATGDIGCFDMSGTLQWSKGLGLPENMYGHATSLLVYQNMLIVQYDQAWAEDGLSKLLALDVASGDTIWETSRDVPNSWSTPMIARAGGRDEIITCSNPWVIAYAPDNGEELWRAECLSGDVAPSPTLAAGMVIVAMDGTGCTAIRPGGSGTVTDTHLAWNWYGSLPDTCSPVGTDEFVFLLATWGALSCVDARTGELLWEQQFDASFNASPAVAGDSLYLLSDTGTMYVVKIAYTYELIGEGVVGEECDATPAFADGRMVIRGAEHLFCIGSDG
jgi:outer membrane protein assembly factor BamB